MGIYLYCDCVITSCGNLVGFPRSKMGVLQDMVGHVTTWYSPMFLWLISTRVAVSSNTSIEYAALDLRCDPIKSIFYSITLPMHCTSGSVGPMAFFAYFTTSLDDVCDCLDLDKWTKDKHNVHIAYWNFFERVWDLVLNLRVMPSYNFLVSWNRAYS